MSFKSLALKLSVPVFLAAATATSGAFAAGPYDRDHRRDNVSVNVYVRNAPPPVRYERIPPRPSHAGRVAWVPGYWSYDRGGYHWVQGGYRPAPRAHSHWQGGRWEHRPQGWVYFNGSWR